MVPEVSADFAVSECRCSHSISENERFGNSDCCFCPRGLRMCCVCSSFCGRLRTTCSFLLVTPNTSPDQHIHFSGIPSDDVSYWDWEVTSQRWSRSPVPICIEWKLFTPFIIQMESQFRKIRFCFSGRKLGQAVQLLCGKSPREATTSTGLCAQDLYVQGWWDTSRSQSNCRSQHRDWRHPVLDIWDLGKTILPISRGKNPKHLQSFIS